MLSKKRFVPIFEKFSKDYDGIPSADHQVWYLSEFLDKEYGLNLIETINNATGKENYKEIYTNDLRKQVPDNFCLYPFTHFQLDPDGRARPCCKYKVGDASWQQDVPKLPDVNIEELWEQEEFQNLRDQFLRNEKPSGCKACWDEEAAGIQSMRLTKEYGGKQHPYATFFHHIPRLYPKTLDLKLSNLCNLKCRICTPFLSSQWIKEIKDLKVNDMGSIESFTNNSKEKFLAGSDNIEILKTWAPGIEFLEFYGGEPLMQQEHDSILQIMHDYGRPAETGLYYNTNSTVLKEKFFELWKLFKEVIINFSVDDCGDRFEYQRKNAKWQETLHNIKMYKQYGNEYNVNLDLRIYATVGVLNVFYLQEFFKELGKLDINVTLNMVHYPHHYSITILPNIIKDIIRDKLLSIENTNIIRKDSLNIDNIIKFMYNTESSSELFKIFWGKTKMHDEYRNESFENTFPEFYNVIKPYL